MEIKLYSVYDKIAEEGGPIFQAKNDEVAARRYLMLMQSETIVDENDYELVYLADFDTEQCLITSLQELRIYINVPKKETNQ